MPRVVQSNRVCWDAVAAPAHRLSLLRHGMTDLLLLLTQGFVEIGILSASFRIAASYSKSINFSGFHFSLVKGFRKGPVQECGVGIKRVQLPVCRLGKQTMRTSGVVQRLLVLRIERNCLVQR